MSFLTTQPTSIVVLGDSTGNEPGEWLRLLAFRIAKAWPTAVVQHRLYNSGSSTYDAAKTLWNGGGSTVTIYNGHVGSTAADYPTAVGGRLAAMVPVTPDVLVVNYGHNHTTESAATFEGKLDTLIAAVLALRSGTPIVISSQNHEKSPATNATAHNTRQAHLATYAAAHSYGYINTYETFQAQGTPNNFVESDGIHPTDTGLGDGSHLWSDAAAAFLLPAADTSYARLTFAQRMLALAPLAWYRLGEASGTTMADSSGNGRDGAYQNSPTLGVTGALTGSGDTDKAVTYNGTTQYGLVTNASWMAPTTYDTTFLTWVKSTDTDGVLIGRSATAPYLLRITTALGLYFEARSTGGSFFAHDGGTSSVRNGSWHFAAGTLRDGYITTYLDGSQLAQNTSSSPSGTPLSDGVGLYLGTRAGGTGPYLVGSQDETAMFGHALPPEIIAELYTAGTTVPALHATLALPVNAGLSMAAKTVAKATVGFAVSAGLAFSVTPVARTTLALPASAGLSFAAATVEQGQTTLALPVSAGLSFGARTAVRTTLALPVAAGLSFSASTKAATTLALPVSVGLEFEASLPSTDGTTTLSLPVSVGLSFAANGGDAPTEDEIDDGPPLPLPLEIEVPVPFVEQSLWRRSVIVPDLSAYLKDPITDQPIVSDAEYDAFPVVEEEVGVPHVIFPDNDDVNDMTYFRGMPIQGLRFLRSEPFGDTDADATIPGVTSMDVHPDDVGAATPFTRARANMEFIMRTSDGTQRRLWSGNVFTRSLGNDGRQPTMNLHALGSLYMADQTCVRPVVSDVPLDCGYLIHRSLGLVTAKRYVTPPTVATDILSNERGAWSDSPLGFVTDLLAKMWTEDGNQWTVAKIPGSRRSYETRLKKTEPEHTITNGARGVYVDLEEDDNGRNIVFGYGTNPDGGYWQNTKYPDNGQVTRLPLAADPRTQPWLHDANGNVTGPNPEFDGNVMPREANVYMGQNSKTVGIRAAQQIIDRESVPSFVGRIVLETDPREGWRGFIQEGDKLTLIGYQGRDLVLHISSVEVDLSSPAQAVTLTVDERSRDAMTVAEIRDRNKEARRDPALRPGNPNRRGQVEYDQIVPFDSESPAGRIEDANGDPLGVAGGQWNIFPIPFATAGRIAKVHFDTGSPMAAGLFAIRPSAATLNSLIGNPLTQDDPLKAHMNTLEGTYGLCAFWGQQGQRMGYSPGREDAGDPFTGDFDEATGFDYVAQANARLYLAVWTAADTTVSGRCFPALVV